MLIPGSLCWFIAGLQESCWLQGKKCSIKRHDVSIALCFVAECSPSKPLCFLNDDNSSISFRLNITLLLDQKHLVFCASSYYVKIIWALQMAIFQTITFLFVSLPIFPLNAQYYSAFRELILQVIHLSSLLLSHNVIFWS